MWWHWFAADLVKRALDLVLGTAGCQPARLGSLPRQPQNQRALRAFVVGKLPTTAGWQPALPKPEGRLLQRLRQILDQIVRMLETYRQSQQALWRARIFAFYRGAMFDQTFYAAEARQIGRAHV